MAAADTGPVPGMDQPVPYSLTAKAEAALDAPAWPRRENSPSAPGDGSGPGITSTTTKENTA